MGLGTRRGLIAGLALAAVLVPAAATSQVSDDGPSAKTLGRLLSRILDCETVRLRAEGRGVCDAGLEGPARIFIEDSGALAFGAPLALEDAPQRAIRSALAIHREMVRFNEKVKQERPDFYRNVEKVIPLGRLGTGEEIARIIAFVASPAGLWINSTHIAADGGQVAAVD